MKRIYLDHNATTPLAAGALAAMLPVLRGAGGNPSSIHHHGIEARVILERARRRIERLLDAPRDSLLFAGTGSEANHLALRGAAHARRRAGLGAHIVASAAEHRAVLDTVRDLAERDGFALTLVPADAQGRVPLEAFAAALRPDTVLATAMLANNETGAVSDIAALVAATRAAAPRAHFHTDAVQAIGKIPVSFAALGADSLALAAHKFHGPKGIAALLLAPGAPVERQIPGGGQERHLRAGTENVAGAVGMEAALQLALDGQHSEAARLHALREGLWRAIAGRLPSALRNSPADGCLPGTLNVSLPGWDGRALVRLLDEAGFSISAGAACSSAGTEPTHVLPPERAASAIRISLGRATTAEDTLAFAEALGAIGRGGPR